MHDWQTGWPLRDTFPLGEDLLLGPRVDKTFRQYRKVFWSNSLALAKKHADKNQKDKTPASASPTENVDASLKKVLHKHKRRLSAPVRKELDTWHREPGWQGGRWEKRGQTVCAWELPCLQLHTGLGNNGHDARFVRDYLGGHWGPSQPPKQ